jgi:hypothetical protein
VTVGGAISGYCETGSANADTRPAIVMMIASTLAKIGRSMKNREKLPMNCHREEAAWPTWRSRRGRKSVYRAPRDRHVAHWRSSR